MKVSPLIVDELRLCLGAAGMAGVLLGVAAVIYVAAVVLPPVLRPAPRVEAPRPERAIRNPVADGDAALVEFVAGLPDAKATSAILAEIYQAAAEQRISLARAEYQMANGSDPAFQLYQITVPVHGHYVEIRRFIRSALARVPHMALDEAGFRRKAIGEGQVDARLRFTVYLRKDRR